MNAEVGTKVAEARRLMETDPDKAIALLEDDPGLRQGRRLPQTVARTMTRRVEVAIELAKKDKVEFDKKMTRQGREGQDRAEEAPAILEADKAKKEGHRQAHGSRPPKAEAEGEYCQGRGQLARRAVEIDPNEIAATIMVYQGEHPAALRDLQATRRTRKKASSKPCTMSTRR